MKMTTAPCKIEGLQCTALEVDLLGKKVLKAASMLLRDPKKYEGVNAGRYNKERGWSQKVVERLDALIEAVEEDLALDIFDVEDNRVAEMSGGSVPTEKKDGADSLAFPTLGGSGSTPSG